MNHEEYTQKKGEILEHTLSRTCEHKGCKRAVCNHAYNEASKAIDSLIYDVIGEDTPRKPHYYDEVEQANVYFSEKEGPIRNTENQLRAEQRKIIGGKE